MSPIGKQLFNLIRARAARRRITTDPAYGGPAPVLRFLRPAQDDRPALPAHLASSVDDGSAEIYFRARPHFGNAGSPRYTSDRGTLPLYDPRRDSLADDDVDSMLGPVQEEEEEEELPDVLSPEEDGFLAPSPSIF
jgi:hypothetical protein